MVMISRRDQSSSRACSHRLPRHATPRHTHTNKRDCRTHPPAAAMSTSSSSRWAKGCAPSAMDQRLSPKLHMSPFVLHRRWLLALAAAGLLMGDAAAVGASGVSNVPVCIELHQKHDAFNQLTGWVHNAHGDGHHIHAMPWGGRTHRPRRASRGARGGCSGSCPPFAA